MSVLCLLHCCTFGSLFGFLLDFTGLQLEGILPQDESHWSFTLYDLDGI